MLILSLTKIRYSYLTHESSILLNIIHLEAYMCICIVSIITDHQEYAVTASINHACIHLGKGQSLNHVSNYIHIGRRNSVSEAKCHKIIPAPKRIVIKKLTHSFKINKDRIAIFDAKKRQTTFMNAIKINYFNRYINKRFKVEFSPQT